MSIETNGQEQFANGAARNDLQAWINASALDTSAEPEDVSLHADSENGLEALRQDSADDRRVQLTDASERRRGVRGGGPRFNHRTRRVLLIALLILAAAVAAPFIWNYLQSYESTDDAQIDGHIDPISSRIDGTVIRVHAEDNDRVQAGELLV